MTGHEKLAAIVRHLEEGHTIVFSTHLHALEVTPKTFAKWQKSGHPLFKADEKSFYIASGKKYLCWDGCSIKVYA